MKIEIKDTQQETIKKIVGTQINQEIYEQLKNEAEMSFMSISDLLRKIIFLYYKDKKEKEIL